MQHAGLPGSRRRRPLVRPIAAVCAIALLTAACGSTAPASGAASSATSSGSPATKSSAPASTITVKFATFAAANAPLTLGAKKFAQYVQADTHGAMKVVVYPHAELGSPATVMQQVEGNTIQFTASSALDTLVPAVDLLLMPYLFSSETSALTALNSNAMRAALWNQFDAHGIHMMGVWGQGFSDILSTKPINSVSDLAGLKIRTYAPVIQTPEYTLLKATAVSVPVNQVYTGLSTNLVQAASDPPVLLLSTKWYEQAHNLALTNDTYTTGPVEVSEKFWTGLTATQRQELTHAFQQSLTWEEGYIRGVNNQALAQLQKDGVKVTHPNIAAFKAAVAPLTTQLKAKFPGVLSKILKAAQAGG